MTGVTESASRIAIVGMACRLPGARSVDEFWSNLCAGVGSIRRLADEELTAAGLDPADLGDPHHVPFGALMDDVDRFDAPFFGITAREAELMDPQHRVFLECAWSALEHAGYDPSRIESAVGVFGGANFDSYLTRNLIPAKVFEDKAAVLQTILANDKDYLATRVAYKLNLRGPAYTVQSGCSTSLVAVHLAMQSLMNYECDMALAGGVAVDIARAQGYWAHEGSVFSPDGRCCAFDASARGTVFGNGCGVVTLKRAEDAIRDGDTIYALVLGSAVNNDGSVKVGFTAPSVSGQSAVIAEALADAGVPAHSIGYVETHGTATPIGDPIEVGALSKAFGVRPEGYGRCAIGSVKTNVGHLDSAAGVAGLIKTALALYHSALPPSLNFTEPNPAIAFEQTSFFVNATLAPWTSGTRPGWPRRAGVSSFGMGGTNAHIVLEEPPAPATPAVIDRGSQLLVWSARTEPALERATEALLARLRMASPDALADIAYTLQSGRQAFACRRALACSSLDEAVRALETDDPTSIRSHVQSGEAPRRPIAFVFPARTPGGLAQVRALYARQPLFREPFDACAADLRADTGLDLAEWLQPSSAAADGPLDEVAWFAAQYALAALWREWGAEPAAVVGSGVGEYVAACVAGVMSRRDALRLIAWPATAPQAPLTVASHAVRLSPPSMPLVSSATGRRVEDDEATNVHYWAEVSERRRDEAAAAEALFAGGVHHIVEVGPPSPVSALLRGRHADLLLVNSLAAEDTPAPERTLLDAAGQLWLAGVPIRWQALHQAPRTRVPLPTYPFERARFWIDPPEEEADDTAAASRKEDPADWLYLPSWKQSAPASAYSRLDPAAANWLVFAGDDAISAEVVAALRRAAPGRVVVVLAAAHFERVAADTFSVRPGEPDDYAALLAALGGIDRLPRLVAHMWSLAAPAAWDPQSVASAHTLGFYSLLALMKALAGTGRRHRLSLRLVTANACDVLGTEQLRAAGTTAAALARVIAQEHPLIDCSCLDVDVGGAATVTEGTTVAERILSELTSALPEPTVAYRGTRRWVQTSEPARLSRGAPGGGGLRRGGVYVVIGGLGRIGLSLATELARSAQARLVLVGRSGVPERTSWPDWIASHPATDIVRQRIERLQAIETAGGEVMVVTADVGDRDAAAAAFAAAEARFGRIDGVILAAGIVDPSAFRRVEHLTPEECERQFRPKVDGLFAIEQILATRQVDLCLVVSSLSSMLGGVGYGAYAPANAFMDAFVRRKARDSATRWMAVNFDAWRWGSVEEDVPGAALALLAMSEPEAADVFQRVVTTRDVPQVIVSTNDLRVRAATWVDLVGARNLALAADGDADTVAPSGEPTGTATDRTMDGAMPAVPPAAGLAERAVIEAWQQVLGITGIQPDETFLDVGGTSLTAVQAINVLERTLGVRIAIEEFIFQTASQLARLCEQKLAERAAPEPPVKTGIFRSLRTALTGRA